MSVVNDIYNIATLYIITGALVFVIHNIYVWDCCSYEFKKEIVTIRFLLTCVIYWPVTLFIIVRVAVGVEIKFRKWKKENGFY